MLEELSFLFQYLLNIAPRVIITIVCFLYLKKVHRSDGALMMAGSILLFILITVFEFYYHYFYDFESLSATQNIRIMNMISRFGGVAGITLFAIGFGYAINRYLKLLKKSKENEVMNSKE